MKYLFFLMLLPQAVFSQVNKNNYLVVGTYDSPQSEGIYVYTFNSSDASYKEVSHIKTSNPSFVTVSPNEKFVYAVNENAKAGNGGEISAFAFNKQTGMLTFINKQLSGGDHPCHVEIDKTGRWLFVANYTSGSLSVLPVNTNGSLNAASTIITGKGFGKNEQRQKGPHVHCNKISADNRWLFSTDLGIDKVMIYAFDDITGKLTPAKEPFAVSPPGSGPRHFTFSPNQQYAYLVEELSGTIESYSYSHGSLKPLQRISTLPENDTVFAGSADIHISGDGKFLYASNRGGSNTIVIFKVNAGNGKLTLVGHQSTLGIAPRNFNFDPSENYLLVGNQNSDEMVIFKRNKQTGSLTDTGKRIHVGRPVCIKWINNE